MTFMPPRRMPVRVYPGWLEKGATRRSAVRARKFDGFPIVLDRSGKMVHGLATNMTSADIQAVVGQPAGTQALSLDGISKHVNLGDNFGWEYTQPFTVASWVNTASVAGGVILSRTQSADLRGWYLAVDPAGQLRFVLRNALANQVSRRTTATVNTGTWKHVVVTYTGSGTVAGVVMYIAAVAQAGFTSFDTLGGNTILNTGVASIGCTNAASNFLNGSIFGAMLWNRVLTGLEVTAVYNAGVGINPRNLSSANNLVGWWAVGNSVP